MGRPSLLKEIFPGSQFILSFPIIDLFLHSDESRDRHCTTTRTHISFSRVSTSYSVVQSKGVHFEIQRVEVMLILVIFGSISGLHEVVALNIVFLIFDTA